MKYKAPETSDVKSLRAKSKRAKMGNVRCEFNGIKFASKKERERYKKLKAAQDCGVIKELKTQFRVGLGFFGRSGRALEYVADFSYITVQPERMILEDVKGRRAGTQYALFWLKKCIVEQRYHGVKIIET